MEFEVAPSLIEVPGRGLINLDAMRVDSAVRAYDERLRFGFNPTNQDWVVYIQYPRDFEGAPYIVDGTPAMPVLGLGHEIPHPDHVLRMLDEKDQWKHGKRSMERMEKEHEAHKKARAEEQDALHTEVAERMEHAMRYHGEGSSSSKIYFSGAKRRRGYRV